ncbi:MULTISPECIES: hypothetical protein [Sorangium]
MVLSCETHLVPLEHPCVPGARAPDTGRLRELTEYMDSELVAHTFAAR